MYSPKVSEKLIPKIYKVARAKGVPMTKLVDGILKETLSKIRVETVPCEVKRKSVR